MRGASSAAGPCSRSCAGREIGSASSAPQLPNGNFAWIRLDRSRMDLYWTKYALHVDLSQRSLELRYGDRVMGRFLVSVGVAGLGHADRPLRDHRRADLRGQPLLRLLRRGAERPPAEPAGGLDRR